MNTRFVTLTVSLQEASPDEMRAALPGSDALKPDVLRSHIESQLSTHGMPLRWAITHINPDEQTAHVEAVVTTTA
ncbi:MAG: hypothetical protein AAFN40_19425 [Cyanobacteria bacterium J06560_6]